MIDIIDCKVINELVNFLVVISYKLWCSGLIDSDVILCIRIYEFYWIVLVFIFFLLMFFKRFLFCVLCIYINVILMWLV